MTAYRIAYPLSVVVFLGASCAPTPAPAPPAASSAPTQVFVVAALGAQHELATGFGFAQLDTLVRRIAPDVVLLEVTPEELAGRVETRGRPEYPRVFWPWLREQDAPRAIAMEADQPLYGELTGQAARIWGAFATEHAARNGALSAWERASIEALVQHWRTPEATQDSVTDAIAEARFALRYALHPEARAGQARWDSVMVAVAREAIAANPGSRLLVVGTFRNRFMFVRELSKVPGAEIVDVAEWMRVGHTSRSRSDATEGREVGPQRHVSADVPNLPHTEPVIAVNPRDSRHLVVASIVVREPKSRGFFESWNVQVMLSRDGGESWTRRQLPGLDQGRSADPWLAWGEDGTLNLSVIARLDDTDARGVSAAWLFRSPDGGDTWAGPEPVPFAHGRHADHPVLRAVPGGGVHVFATGDAPELPPDPRASPTRRAPHHRRLAGSESSTATRALVAQPGFRPETNAHLGSGVVFGRGHFLLSYFDLNARQPSTLWALRSNDGGQTYQRAPITAEHVPLLFPMMASGSAPRTGRTRAYAVWTRSFERPHVMIAHSEDEGETWSAARRVHADSSRALRIAPNVAVSESGKVAVIWIESRRHEHIPADSLRVLMRREDVADCWDVYVAVSRDGTETFTAPVRLTPETTCSDAAGNGGAGRRWHWGGDYLGITWDSEENLHPVWVDSRTGTYQLWTVRMQVQ